MPDVPMDDVRSLLVQLNLRSSVEENSWAQWVVTVGKDHGSEVVPVTITSTNRFADREQAEFAQDDVAGLLLELDIRPPESFTDQYPDAMAPDADYLREYGEVPPRTEPTETPWAPGDGEGDGGGEGGGDGEPETGLGEPGDPGTGLGDPGDPGTGLGDPGDPGTGLGDPGDPGTGLGEPGGPGGLNGPGEGLEGPGVGPDVVPSDR